MNPKYLRWLNDPDLDPVLKQELQLLTNEAEIEDRFYQSLSFGTAGMRGLLGAGTNRMNRYTVRRATEGFAQYLLSIDPATREKGIVIAYDSRHKSADFAKEAARVLANHGIHVYLFAELQPTPLLSFAVRNRKTIGGIMITASHNPAEYNGYKVYGADGAQLLDDPAKQILLEIEKVTDELHIPLLTQEAGIHQGLIHILDDEIERIYLKQLRTLVQNREVVREMGSNLNIVFTPLHGTGNKLVRQILADIGFTNVFVVPEQEKPDPNFSTVSSPNPESIEAFALAIPLAQQKDAELIIGTDPDADRLGVVVKQHQEYVALTGNQLGALLLFYLLDQKQQQGVLPPNGVVIKSIVTSEMGRKIANSFGVDCLDVLTGFKYVAEKIAEYDQTQTNTFLMGYEESYGYLVGDFVRDKDAIQTAMLVCEMAAYYQKQGFTLIEVLNQLFIRYGTFLERLESFTFKEKQGLEQMDNLMALLRQYPVSTIGSLQMDRVEDYLVGRSGYPISNVLKYYFHDGSWLAVRPSGTEPKIKFYYGSIGQNQAEAEAKIAEMRNYMLQVTKQV